MKDLNLKADDEVESEVFGSGRVAFVEPVLRTEYPVKVVFEDGNIRSFTESGAYCRICTESADCYNLERKEKE